MTCFVKFEGHRTIMNGKIKVGWGSLEFNLSFQECSSASLTEYSPCGSGDPSSNLSKKSTVWNVLHLVRSTLLAAAAESRGSVVQSLKSVSTGLVRLDPWDKSGSANGGPVALSQRSNSSPGMRSTKNVERESLQMAWLSQGSGLLLAQLREVLTTANQTNP